MSVIVKLSDKIANMIAAGEVVDRPASVIKELTENAIDAQATKIKIEITGFGLKEIKISDNGLGMDSKDALLALERHATSKIKSESDLNHISSLGFRGEALPSIASVSRLTLKTKTADSDGTQIYFESGKLKSESACKHNTGTTVIVNDLFYNTPARFKYIKSENAEKTAIYDLFDALALSNPGIAFELIMDGKLIKETYGNSDIHSLVSRVYGDSFAKEITIVKEKFQKMDIDCYLIDPKFSRSNKKDITIFINNRYIRNYSLSNAVIDGYHSYLMTGKYPVAIIYIKIDPALIDVNVHPQKYEIKLMNEYLLAYQLANYIKKALSDKNHEPVSVEIGKIKNVELISLDLSGIKPYETPSFEVNEEVSTFNLGKLPTLEYIGSLGGTYLLFQNQEGLYLIDQHAAAERIRYEKIKSEISKPDAIGRVSLFGREINLLSNDLKKITAYSLEFKELGFEFKDNKLISYPSWIADKNIEEIVEEMLLILDSKLRLDIGSLRDNLAKEIACKGAIKANHLISRIEVNNLLTDLNNAENPYTCPHGRPVIIKLTFSEIEKLFKRTL